MDGGVFYGKDGTSQIRESKKNLVGFKLTDNEIKKLREYASRHNMTVTQVLQKGIDMQYAMEKLERS